MAFVNNLLDDEEQQKQNLVTSGQESGVVSGTPMAGGETKAQTSNWVNLDKYLKANEGQGQAIAGAVTQGADTAIKSAAGKLNELEVKAKGQDQSQTQALTGLKQTIAADPTKVNATEYNNQVSAAYKGPTQVEGVEGYDDAYKAWGNAKSQYEAVKDDSAAGRQAAVASAFKPQAANSYTKGMGILDSFILGGDAKGKQALSDFATQNQGITESLNQTRSKAQSALDAQKAAFEAERASVQQAVKDKREAVTGAVGSKQAQVDAKNRALNEREDVLRSIMDGVIASSGGRKSLDAGKYFAGSGRYTLGDLTTDEERATLEALNNLSDSNSRVDLAAYRPTGQAGVNVSQDAIKAGLGFDYDPETNSLTALANDGSRAMSLTNDPYYKQLIQNALKAKGYS
jgi:hypothetical protein